MKIKHINPDININDIKQKILKHDVISFDIFDTLILRPYVKPTDLFEHLEKLENLTGFANARIKAEERAREISNEEDITFDEIYNCIEDKYKFVKNKELELEQQILQRNNEIYTAFDYAKQNNKKIIITSDMYLSKEFILNILKLKGYTGFDKLYLSSDIKLTKWTGNLYKYILNDLNVESSKILHIGDNIDSDIEKAQRIGIDTYFYKKVIDRYIENNKHKPILDFIDNLQKSILIGVLAINTTKNDYNKNYWEKVGYEYGGITCYSYMKWLENQVIKDNINDIMFVARDGYSLKKVFDTFNNGISTHYIYAPRFLNLICTLDFDNNFDKLKIILNYYKNKSQNLKKEFSDSCNFEEALNLFNKFKNEIKELSAIEREQYKNYLSINKINTDATCTVDTYSWNFSAQKLINCGLEKKVKGYYWQTSKDKNLSYSAFFREDSKEKVYFRDWNFMELLMTAPEPPIENIINNKIIHKNVSAEEQKRIEIYPYISAGIVNFARDINSIFGNKNVYMDNSIVEKWINLFADFPSCEDIDNMSKVKHAIDSGHNNYVNIFPSWYRKKLSVIVPVYNVEKTLSQTLDSIIYQTYKNIEIICVNDGSTDNSGKILEDYAKNDTRIQIINKENAGLAAARNTGLEYVSGDYVAFLDSDDWVNLDFYEKLIDRLECDNTDISVGEVHYIYPSYIGYNEWVNEHNFRTNKNIVTSIKDKQHNIYACACWNKVYKAKLIKNNKLKFPDGLFIEDVPFTFASTILANNISLVRGAILNYRQQEDSIMKKAKTNRTSFDIFKIYEVCEKFLEEVNLPENTKQEYKKILDNFEIFNIFGWVNYTCPKYKEEFFNVMRDKFKSIKVKDNQFINSNTKLIRKAVLNSTCPEKAILYIENPPLSLIKTIFSIQNKGKHKVIVFLGLKFKFKSKKCLKRLNLEENSFLEDIFSAKNIDIRKVITIFGIKFKFKSQKLIEKRRWQDLQSSINYVNQQLQEHAQKYNEVIEKLNNKLDEQAQKYNNDITVLHNKLDLQVQKLNNIKQVVDFNRGEIKNNFDITCELLVSSLSQGENNNG